MKNCNVNGRKIKNKNKTLEFMLFNPKMSNITEMSNPSLLDISTIFNS